MEQRHYHSAAIGSPENPESVFVDPDQLVDPVAEAEIRHRRLFDGRLGRAVGIIAGLGFSAYSMSGLLAPDRAHAALPDPDSVSTLNDFYNPDRLRDFSNGAASGEGSPITIGGPIAGQDLAKRTFTATTGEAAPEDDPTVYRAGTYNILGSFTYGNIVKRAQWASKVIKNNELDVLALQEVTPEQRREFIKPSNLGNQFRFFPKAPWKDPNSRVYMAYRKDRWKKLGSGFVTHPFYGDRNLENGGQAPFVILKDKVTGNIKRFLGFHSVAWNTDPGSDKWGGEKREKTAQRLQHWGTQAKYLRRNIVTFLMGDANGTNNLRNHADHLTPKPKDLALNGNRMRLGYCIMTAKNTIQDTLDTVRNTVGHCVDKSRTFLRNYTVDWVFKTRGDRVTRWSKVNSSLADMASDHDLVVAEVSQLADTPVTE